jgi:hypothetical protein
MSTSHSDEIQRPRRTLAIGRLNVVGETHNESDLRRDLEKRFCAAKTQNANYWTEAEFPDLYQQTGTRKARSGPAQVDPIADLMEFRAAHSAALLITRFEKLADDAHRVATAQPAAAADAFRVFLGETYKNFVKIQQRLGNSWVPTQSDAVNTAAQAVFTRVDSLRQAFFSSLNAASLDQNIRSTQALSDNGHALRDLVPALEKAVGVSPSPDRNAAALAQDMRVRRSAFMGLAAVLSKQVGVWKIGDLHVTDLTDGTAKVDTTRMNLVSEDDFSHELQAWGG